ncbi:hypothetical protein BTO04_12905 [Polaribacter sp. SA4-10]|uniref:hypothetical protein n=1 Tax=Polaribacter sp. SA4-10 TaxID=754397 RepID=UPI000B3C3AB4|nr:hypothetical protein [Polaribacter sp. SA4-10]ARV07532.1 hypothetical protein BTO04_12905 [Polaribacter sp. SA4-10]
MIKKIIIGIIAGTLIGLFISSIFMLDEIYLKELLLTKITATSIITGAFCGIYAHLSKSKLQVFLVSILIGAVVFYIKYIVTGHDYDPITMGIFVGSMLGGTFAVIRKITHSFKVFNRLRTLQKNG